MKPRTIHPSPRQTPVGSAVTSARTTAPDFFSAQILSAQRFYLDVAPSPARPLRVICGGVEHCDAAYHIRRDYFDYVSIEFVARGEGTVTLFDQTINLVPGVIFAYGPGIPHEMRSSPARPLVKYFVDFAGHGWKPYLPSPAPQPGQAAQTSQPEVILRLFDDLVRTGAGQTPLTPNICATILQQLMLRMAESAVPLGTIGSLAFETYQQCRQHMDQHYLEARGLAEIARDCNVDAAYLCRLFARFDRQSPYRYLMHLKMRDAAQRLAIPGTLAKQVAQEMGFADPFHFSRVFRRVIGVSPSQFVQMHRPMVRR